MVELSEKKDHTFGQIKIQKKDVLYTSFAEMPVALVEELSPSEYAEIDQAFQEGGSIWREIITVEYPNEILN